MTDHPPIHPSSGGAESGPIPSDAPRPFLSVIVRSQGRRSPMLAEALASLSLQTSLDFEVCVVRHEVTDAAADQLSAAAVAEVLAKAPSTVGFRCRLLSAPPGTRGVPLNVGIKAARGRYLAFLDDDDLAQPEWVATFRRAAAAAPGMVIRARASSQPVRAQPGSGYQVLGPAVLRYRSPFDLMDHLHENRTPICALAWPAELFVDGGARVDESLVALEDWDLLLQVVARCAVSDVDLISSVYRSWVDDHGSRGQEGESAWAAARDTVRRRIEKRDWHLRGEAMGQVRMAADELAHFRRFANELAGELGGDLSSSPLSADGDAASVALVKSEFERLHRELATSLQRGAELDAELQQTRTELARLKSSPDALLEAARRSILIRLGLRKTPAPPSSPPER